MGENSPNPVTLAPLNVRNIFRAPKNNIVNHLCSISTTMAASPRKTWQKAKKSSNGAT
jgi:hypothetical protein